MNFNSQRHNGQVDSQIVFGPKSDLRYDLERNAEKQLREILQAYRTNRPESDQVP